MAAGDSRFLSRVSAIGRFPVSRLLAKIGKTRFENAAYVASGGQDAASCRYPDLLAPAELTRRSSAS